MGIGAHSLLAGKLPTFEWVSATTIANNRAALIHCVRALPLPVFLGQEIFSQPLNSRGGLFAQGMPAEERGHCLEGSRTLVRIPTVFLARAGA